MGDFLNGPPDPHLPPEILRGIELHRKVDRYTDSHSCFRSSRSRLYPQFGHYAGVLVDIFYDHFLAKNWSFYAPHDPLESFAKRVYAALQSEEAFLSPRLAAAAPRFEQHNLFVGYRDLEGIRKTLQNISKRTRRKSSLDRAMQPLQSHYTQFEAEFLSFFPQLCNHYWEASAHSVTDSATPNRHPLIRRR